jgi:fatty-acyl-CoA synthase
VERFGRSRGGEATFVAPPFFHAWGLSHVLFGLGIGSTVVTHRRFDPDRVLRAVGEHRCTMLVVVPTLLRRLVDRPDPAGLDRSALKAIATSGSQLDGALALEAMDRFGDIVYNLYGSTENASIAVATPEDLRAAPGCAGRPPRGVHIQLLDESGRAVPPGSTGRIFVANGAGFGGYTGGGTKAVVHGLTSTGDVGHIDPDGRLHIAGRDDDMIVSGGENVFPRELEELLVTHPAVLEAAAIGVPDEEFGQRLRAFVVVRPGTPIDADAIRAFARDHLARFKVPRDVVFVDALPRNAAGKVLNWALHHGGD